MAPLLLASASPRRRALLTELGWDFKAVSSSYEELPCDRETATEMSLRFALGKALDVARTHPDSFVIGADTSVVIDGETLGKPRDEEEAFAMLSKLQGRTHEVVTAVAVISPGQKPLTAVETTKVTFRKLSEAEIKAYIATGESMDKAGAYAIQGHGMLLVESLDGCYFNVVGLPVERLSVMLAQLGFDLTAQWGS